jgi:hypothetical protein
MIIIIKRYAISAFAGLPNLQAAFVVSCVPALCRAKRPTNELKETQFFNPCNASKIPSYQLPFHKTRLMNMYILPAICKLLPLPDSSANNPVSG